MDEIEKACSCEGYKLGNDTLSRSDRSLHFVVSAAAWSLAWEKAELAKYVMIRRNFPPRQSRLALSRYYEEDKDGDTGVLF